MKKLSYRGYLARVRHRRTPLDVLYGFAVGRCWRDRARSVPGWKSRQQLVRARSPGRPLDPPRQRCWGHPGPRLAFVTYRGWRRVRAAEVAQARSLQPRPLDEEYP